MDFYHVKFVIKIIVKIVLFYVQNVKILFVKNVAFVKNVKKKFVLNAEKHCKKIHLIIVEIKKNIKNNKIIFISIFN